MASPPRTKPLVAMAEVDRPVMVVTTVAVRMMAMVSPAAQTEEGKKKPPEERCSWTASAGNWKRLEMRTADADREFVEEREGLAHQDTQSGCFYLTDKTRPLHPLNSR